MEIILSQRCKSFTGTISRTHGYAIKRTGNRFFSKRNPGNNVPPGGHWKFIVSCAELAKQGFMLTDIRVSANEIMDAMHEMGHGNYLWRLKYPETLNAAQVLTLKSELGL